MSLSKIQAWSFAAKAATTALGVVQTLIVVRLLTVEEYGLVGLVMSIGGLVGVTQHLGVVDGAIREIAVSKNTDEAARVHWVSHVVRQSVTVPLSLLLFVLAGWIAGGIYARPEIAIYIQIFAGILLLQGLQDVLGATLTGVKLFKKLYVIQVITAAINIAVFAWLTWRMGVTGFFAAIVVTTAIMVVLLWGALRQYSPKFGLRDVKEALKPESLKRHGKMILSISVYMYVARVLFILWQRLPILLLGGVLAADQLGWLNASLGFGSRLVIIGMALSEVNLSWMSSLFVKDKGNFRQVVQDNIQKLSLVLAGATLFIMFFGPDILNLIRPEYEPARRIIVVMAGAFFVYSLLDIATASIFAAANKPRTRAIIYGLMSAVTAAGLGYVYATGANVLLAAVSVLLGAVVAYAVCGAVAWKYYKISLLSWSLLFVYGIVLLAGAWLLRDPGIWWRAGVFVVLGAYVGWEYFRNSRFQSTKTKQNPEHETQNTKPLFICFAGGFYDAPTWTNRQHIMTQVARIHEVLYVEPRVWIVKYLWENIFAPKRIWRFLQRVVSAGRNKELGIRNQGLMVKAQWNLIPGSRRFKFISWFNHYILNRWNVLRGVDREHAVVWIYDTEAAEYLSDFKDNFVIYDCVDDHAAQAGAVAARVQEEEQKILKRANLVTVTSEKLLRDKGKVNDNVYLVEQAGDVARFEPTPSPSLVREGNRPVIGSVGALDDYKYDFDLIYKVAKSNPEWDFKFIGRPLLKIKNKQSRMTFKRINKLENVQMLGAMARERVPEEVAKFDVCVIPYRYNKYNQSSVPLKFWEFMATGKPIIVSGLPELKTYANKGLINFAKNANEFSVGIKNALGNPGDSQERMLLARGHSWEKRAQSILEYVLS